jgi:hypothetical protein
MLLTPLPCYTGDSTSAVFGCTGNHSTDLIPYPQTRVAI